MSIFSRPQAGAGKMPTHQFQHTNKFSIGNYTISTFHLFGLIQRLRFAITFIRRGNIYISETTIVSDKIVTGQEPYL